MNAPVQQQGVTSQLMRGFQSSSWFQDMSPEAKDRMQGMMQALASGNGAGFVMGVIMEYKDYFAEILGGENSGTDLPPERLGNIPPPAATVMSEEKAAELAAAQQEAPQIPGSR